MRQMKKRQGKAKVDEAVNNAKASIDQVTNNEGGHCEIKWFRFNQQYPTNGC